MVDDVSREGVKILLSAVHTLHRMSDDFDVRVDKLSLWQVTIPSAAYKDSYPALFEQLEENKRLYSTGDSGIVLELQFPYTFPNDPPMVRVVRPRFEYMTGHVTIGGSLCAQFLTASGWTAQMPMESLLLSVRNLFIDGNAQVANHASDYHPIPHLDYGFDEARIAFKRAVETHGWGTPTKKMRTA